jgi:hypothetical protein
LRYDGGHPAEEEVMRRVVAFGLLTMLLLALAFVPAGAQTGGGSTVTVYVLDLVVGGQLSQPVPQYTVRIIQEGPYTEADARFRAVEIIKDGLRWGNLYYPENRVQRVQVYVSPNP